MLRLHGATLNEMIYRFLYRASTIQLSFTLRKIMCVSLFCVDLGGR
jgi:hypothetical protein